jgi:sugar phosphate isomerase/epimerase
VTYLDRLSFQLYSARLMPTLEDQFDMLERIGYRLVEPWGGLLDEPERLRGLLDSYAMQAPSCHVGIERLRSDPPGTAALLRGLGVEIAVVPAPPQGRFDNDEAGWRALGAELQTYAAPMADAGLALAWHNHHWEYKPTASGAIPLDLIFDAAPDLQWEADLAWIVRGGADPIAELAKRPSRTPLLHVKDIAPAGECADEDGWADVGHGVLDWTSIMAAAVAAGATTFVVEHDKPSDAERFARRSYETISRW